MTASSFLRSAILAGLGAGALAACSPCTDIGCVPGARLDFNAPLTSPGEYTFIVVADGTEMTCTFTLPAAAPDACDERLWPVTAAEAMQADGDGPPDIASLMVDGVFASLELTVLHDGERLMAEAIAPDYRDAGTGLGCNGCPRAEHTLPSPSH
jgi:hypothetical protein